jgi:type II secretory pathway predicted ATPase ExeA/outer membrane protein OmpA-like peptidoglycan-associated protein
MYESFFHFREKPFSLLPDPSFVYLSSKHREALTILEYGLLNQAGFTVLTGEVGSGKTTLMRYLLDRLDNSFTVGLISHTHRSLGDLMECVCSSFNLKISSIKNSDLHRSFVDFVTGEHARGQRTLLIVDEAQNLGAENLERLRLLSNINFNKDVALQLLLLGQPQLRDLLREPGMEQFVQRVSASYHLGRLGVADTKRYIRHRVALAGAPDEIFTWEACETIFSYSQGVPRLINLICDTALVYAYGEGSRVVTAKIVEEFIEAQAAHLLIPLAPLDETRRSRTERMSTEGDMEIEREPMRRPSRSDAGLTHSPAPTETQSPARDLDTLDSHRPLDEYGEHEEQQPEERMFSPTSGAIGPPPARPVADEADIAGSSNGAVTIDHEAIGENLTSNGSRVAPSARIREPAQAYAEGSSTTLALRASAPGSSAVKRRWSCRTLTTVARNAPGLGGKKPDTTRVRVLRVGQLAGPSRQSSEWSTNQSSRLIVANPALRRWSLRGVLVLMLFFAFGLFWNSRPETWQSLRSFVDWVVRPLAVQSRDHKGHGELSAPSAPSQNDASALLRRPSDVLSRIESGAPISAQGIDPGMLPTKATEDAGTTVESAPVTGAPVPDIGVQPTETLSMDAWPPLMSSEIPEHAEAAPRVEQDLMNPGSAVSPVADSAVEAVAPWETSVEEFRDVETEEGSRQSNLEDPSETTELIPFKSVETVNVSIDAATPNIGTVVEASSVAASELQQNTVFSIAELEAVLRTWMIPVNRIDGNRLVVDLGDKVLFADSSIALDSVAQAFLESLAVYIDKSLPIYVRVIGHTDSRGSADFNARISERRAEVVARFLASKGIPDKYLSHEGKGETEPKVDSSQASASGLYANRRIELELVKPGVVNGTSGP